MLSGEVLLSRRLDDARTAVVAVSDRRNGDLAVDLEPARLEERRRTVTAHRWTWLEQRHGSDVVTVAAPGAEAGSPADGSVTAATGAALAVHTADCAPVGLIGAAGVVGVAHAGWRGLVAGVLGSTVDAMRDAGAGQISAVVGPCIQPGCYEFGEDDLAAVVEAIGDDVRGVSRAGRPALDLSAGVIAVLARSGVTDVIVDGRCTGCDPRRFSHRVSGDRGRQALVAWIDP